MSEKFNLGNDFNLFDEWGNYVGKFTPAGGGLDGVFFIIGLVFAWTFGFLVFVIIRLITKGYQAAKNDDWDKAILYWIIPGLLALPVALSFITTSIAEAEKHQIEIQDAKVEYQNIITNPPVGIEMLKTNKCTSDCLWGNDETYIFIEVANRWRGRITVYENENTPRLRCTNHFRDWIYDGAREQYHCVGEDVSLDTQSNFCFDITYELSFDDPLYKYHPQTTICITPAED